MDITFDPEKDAVNRLKHGISLAEAANLQWDEAWIWVDRRFDYGEKRIAALVPLNGRIYFVGFVVRSEGFRIITLRKANLREVRSYATHDQD